MTLSQAPQWTNDQLDYGLSDAALLLAELLTKVGGVVAWRDPPPLP